MIDTLIYYLDIHVGAITAVATTIIAAFTIALACSTKKLWGITKESVDLAREEFTASHRPRIILRNVSVINENGYKIIYSLVNIGGSKATIVNSWILTEFINPSMPIRNIRSAGHDDLGKVELQAGECRDFNCELVGDTSLFMRFGKNTLRFGENSNADLFFAGSVRYADNFNNIRDSFFRRKFEGGGFCRTNDADHEYAD
ncbi:MAG TPA: hypothetical protein VMV56_10860 [Williamwhitmania sp.]|nr:hypothetical protein [Williamwhitmania sp.]